MTRYTAAQMLTHLRTPLDDQADLAEFIRHHHHSQEQDLPLYLKLFLVFGTLVATAFFTSLISLILFLAPKNSTIAMAWSGLCMGIACILLHTKDTTQTIGQTILLQTSVVAMISGKLVFVAGLNGILGPWWGISFTENFFFKGLHAFLEPWWSTTLGLLLVTVISYPLYRLAIDHFLSCCALLLSVFMSIREELIFGQHHLWMNDLFFLAHIIGAALFLTYDKIKQDHMPIAYAIVCSMCGYVLFLTTHAEVGYIEATEILMPTPLDIILAVTLGLTLRHTIGKTSPMASPATTVPTILTVCGCLALCLLSAPGVILAIILMIIGYARHDRILTVLGVLLLPVFISLYYYNMEVTLLHKSVLLTGSGLLLLAGKFYITSKGWDQEST